MRPGSHGLLKWTGSALERKASIEKGVELTPLPLDFWLVAYELGELKTLWINNIQY